MIPCDLYLTRSEFVAVTGVTNDVLTFWVRTGLVRPEGGRAGRGKHLRFPFYEANLAAFMLKFRDLGLNIDALLGIADIYRRAIAWAENLCVSPSEAITLEILARIAYRTPLDGGDEAQAQKKAHAVFKQAVSDLTVGIEGTELKLTESLVDKLTSLIKDKRFEEVLACAGPYNELMLRPSEQTEANPVHFWRNDKGWSRGDGYEGLATAQDEGVLHTITLNIAPILYQVWNRG